MSTTRCVCVGWDAGIGAEATVMASRMKKTAHANDLIVVKCFAESCGVVRNTFVLYAQRSSLDICKIRRVYIDSVKRRDILKVACVGIFAHVLERKRSRIVW